MAEVTYANASEAMNAPFEPKTPCRNMETRPCVKLSLDDTNRFLVNQCPLNHCVRYEVPYNG